MKNNAGTTFPLNSNADILQIDSPKDRVEGPWMVVHKNTDDRWVIVLMHWDNKPRLGIRWFYGMQGTPSVRQYATWLIIPDDLTNAVLDKLPLSPQKRRVINEVLLGERKLNDLIAEKKLSKIFTGIKL